MILNIMDLKASITATTTTTTPPHSSSNNIKGLKDAHALKHEALCMAKYIDQMPSNLRKEMWEKILRVLPLKNSVGSPRTSPLSSPRGNLSPISSPHSPILTQCPSFESFLLEWENGPYFPYMMSLLQDALIQTRNEHPEISRKNFITPSKFSQDALSSIHFTESHSLFGTDFVSVLQQLILLQHWIPTLESLPILSKRTLLDTASSLGTTQSWSWRSGESNLDTPYFSSIFKSWMDSPMENMREITIFFGAIGFLATNSIIEGTYMFPGSSTPVFTSAKSQPSVSHSPPSSNLPKPPPSLTNGHQHHSLTTNTNPRTATTTTHINKHFPLPETTTPPLDRRAQSPSPQFWYETPTPIQPHTIPPWVNTRGVRSLSPLSYESVYHTPESQQDRRSPSPNKILSSSQQQQQQQQQSHCTPTNTTSSSVNKPRGHHLESIAVSALEALGSVASNFVNLASPPHTPIDSQNNSRTSTPIQTPPSPPTIFSHQISFSNGNIHHHNNNNNNNNNNNSSSSNHNNHHPSVFTVTPSLTIDSSSPSSTSHKRRDMCGDNNNNSINIITTKKQCVMSISNILCS